MLNQERGLSLLEIGCMNYLYMLFCFIRIWLFVNPWTIACQAPLSVGLSRQEYWSGLPFSTPADFPDPRIEPESPALASGFFTTSTTGEAHGVPREMLYLLQKDRKNRSKSLKKGSLLGHMIEKFRNYLITIEMIPQDTVSYSLSFISIHYIISAIIQQTLLSWF